MKRILTLTFAALALVLAAQAEEIPLTQEDAAQAYGQETQGPAGDSDLADALPALTPLGGDQLETVLVQAFNSWVQTAVSAPAADGELALSPEAPAHTLLASSAIRSGNALIVQGAGQLAGLQGAANRLFAELTAWSQDPASSGMDAYAFRAGYVPQYFTLSSFQTASASGAVSADCAMLFLTDQGGSRLEGPAYVAARFFREDGVILWLSNDMQVLQSCAQLQSIRQLGGTLSQQAAPENGWGSISKTVANGGLYNPAAAATPAPAAADASSLAADQPIAAPTPTPTPEKQYVTISISSAASIREQPQQDAKRIAQAKPGEQYELLAVNDNGWLAIRTPDGTFGYASPKLFNKLPGEETGPRAVATRTMQLKDIPSPYGHNAGQVLSGKSYYIVNDRNSDWIQLRIGDGNIGWLERKYVR